jgi:hypothetical protein
LEVNVKLKAQVFAGVSKCFFSLYLANKVQFDPTLFALNVIVKIPLPTNTAVVTPSVLTGKTKCATVMMMMMMMMMMLIILCC